MQPVILSSLGELCEKVLTETLFLTRVGRMESSWVGSSPTTQTSNQELDKTEPRPRCGCWVCGRRRLKRTGASLFLGAFPEPPPSHRA